ncbi:MAG: YraN family protein [Alphaproteobacteria bacterium]|nr:YraN family protein [Alphaproteobacteria bacterium]
MIQVCSGMLSNYVKGINAEARVVNILINYGCDILGRRVKTKYGEIDILAYKNNTVVAVEVKQRKTLNIARECLTNRQMHRISKALQLIIYERNLLFENYRIDVVLLDRIGNYEYIINAFSFETDTDI